MQNLENLARQFYSTIDSQDWEKLDALVSPDAQVQVGTSPEIAFRDSKNLRALYAAFPDGHHIIEDTLTDGDRIVSVCRFEGTHSGMFRELEATHKKISFKVIHIDQFNAGKLVHHFGQPDMLALINQITPRE